MADNPNLFDLVVLGGGSGGYAAALRGAQLGLSVCLIEGDKLGGTCLHRGCIPTKALLQAAETADTVRNSAQFGVNATLDGVDMAKVNAYQERVVNGLYRGLKGLVKARGVKYVSGWGKLVSADTVEVTGQRYTGRHIVLATGSRPRTLPGLTIEGKIITSDEALTLDYVPSSVIVLGGGVIGAEFASLWRSFGAEVTLVEAMPHLLPAEDEAISRAFERGLRRRKIVFTTGDPFASASQSETGVGVTLASGKQLAADLLLVAVGRVPVTEHLGYLEAGIKLENGFIHTDQRLHTGIDNVYAVGDIVPGQQLAHRGFAQGVFVAEEIAGFNPSPVLESGIPRVTYAEPEVASVGLTEATARQLHGDQIRVAEFNLAANGKSKILATAGLVKVVSLTDGSVLGIHMIGSRVGELIGEAQLIVNWEAKPDDLARLIHAHPTQGEALGEAFLALSGKPLHALS